MEACEVKNQKPSTERNFAVLCTGHVREAASVDDDRQHKEHEEAAEQREERHQPLILLALHVRHA